jgi:sortase A
VKIVRFLSVLILVAGACLSGRAVYLHAKAKLAGVLIRRSWEHGTLHGQWQPPWPWADTHAVARLRIPRLAYDEIVLQGATAHALAFGPALMLGGAAPGKPGNVLLAGHRTSWFLPLEKIAQGDTIQIEWFDAHRGSLVQRSYAVKLIRVVDPHDLALLAPTTEDALTLITCYPFGHSAHSPQRFVVRASPLGPSRLAARSSGSSYQIGRREARPSGTEPRGSQNIWPDWAAYNARVPVAMGLLGTEVTWQCVTIPLASAVQPANRNLYPLHCPFRTYSEQR